MGANRISTVKGYNNNIAVTPFVKKTAELKGIGNFGVIEQKTSLEELKVVFGNGDLYAGDSVFVHAENFKTWGAVEYEVDGQKFVLCPKEQVRLVRKQEMPCTAPMCKAPSVNADGT